MEKITITNQQLNDIQEFTLRAQELGVYSKMLNEMNMCRPAILKLLAVWAGEFTEKYKDWLNMCYYDQLDDFIYHKFALLYNPYIDCAGNPYVENVSLPAGGGMHKDCEFNADALYAFYTMESREKITAYLTSKGFIPWCQAEDYEEWTKGNTKVFFEEYDHKAKQWGYMHTELIEVK